MLRFFAAALLLSLTMPAVAEEPLWMRYPAVSPDGSTIAFSYGGQLYSVAAEGGQAQPLTGGDAYATRPQWSPDGQWIAFAADRFGNLDVFIMPARGGEARRLTFNSAGDVPTGFSADGQQVLFTSRRLGDPVADFYAADAGMRWQLYGVPVAGGREQMILPIPALEVVESPDGGRYLYENLPSGEQPWRKHETSAGTRDIWLYDAASGDHQQLTTFAGHDREPLWAADGESFYALSEGSGSLNIWRQPLTPGAQATQVTFHEKHPVRSPSISAAGDLVYSFDGEIWRLKVGANAPEKVVISLNRDALDHGPRYRTYGYGATELAVSPVNDELAFILRGEVYVVAGDSSVTRRITTTPEQERNLSFSPDGRSLFYAAERDGSWGLYRSDLADEEEWSFSDATLISESIVLDTEADEFQPLLSPDGAQLAFLRDRDEIALLDQASGEVRTLLPATKNYSYADGDIWFAWSPDSRWLAASYAPNANNPDVALIPVADGGEAINITPNGYLDFGGLWAPDGQSLYWLSDLLGLRRSDQNASQVDIFVAALSRAAEDRLQLSDKELERARDPEPGDGTYELEGVERRLFRVTPASSDIWGYDITADGETLIYVTLGVDSYGWSVANVYRLAWRSGYLTQVAADLPLDSFAMSYDRATDVLYLLGSDGINTIDAEGNVDTIYYDAELALDAYGERAYIFDHVWRQTKAKFYEPGLHGVDWDFYGAAYKRFLPHIDNQRDFAEMLSEMVGELNASHTGAYFYPWRSDGDDTAALGLYFDPAYRGAGAKVVRVLEGGPADRVDSAITQGTLITAIDGQVIGADQTLDPFLNRRAGQKLRLDLADPAGETWVEYITPISSDEEDELAYWEWVANNRALVKELSGGRLGYVHLRAMDEENYQVIYANAFGRYGEAEGLIVDVRFNGGGNLTNQLLTLLSGTQYLTWQPRGRKVGIEPIDRWTKPSLVLTNEAAYSDGSIFPFSYRELGLGKLVGMPVPGTGTAVWWEDQQDPSLVYGIPQAGFGDLRGAYLENQQVEPDIKVPLLPADILAGRDPQLEAAVQALLAEAGTPP